MKTPTLVAACALLVVAASIEAHHPFAAEFDANQPITRGRSRGSISSTRTRGSTWT